MKKLLTMFDEQLKSLNTVLNRVLKKKYDWFDKINVVFYEQKKDGVPKINGVIYVDEEWYYKMWREYHYSTNPVNPNIEDISIGDIIGGKMANDLRDDIVNSLSFVFGENIKGFQWFNIYVRIKENEEDMLTEEVSNEEVSNIDPTILNFLRRRANKKILDIVGLKLTQITFENSEYIITSIRSKKENERELKKLLSDNNLFDFQDYEQNERDPRYQKIIRTIRYFLNEYLEPTKN